MALDLAKVSGVTTRDIESTNDQKLAKLRRARPGAVHRLADGRICTLVKPGRMSGQITRDRSPTLGSLAGDPVAVVANVLRSPSGQAWYIGDLKSIRWLRGMPATARASSGSQGV